MSIDKSAKYKVAARVITLMAHCKACGAEIIWIKMVSGKSMPCDARPIPFTPVFPATRSDMTLVTESGMTVKGRYDADSEYVGYRSHFASCPAAGSFRRQR